MIEAIGLLAAVALGAAAGVMAARQERRRDGVPVRDLRPHALGLLLARRRESYRYDASGRRIDGYWRPWQQHPPVERDRGGVRGFRLYVVRERRRRAS